MGEVNLIDTHQHLIWHGRFGYGWTDDIAELANCDFTLEDYSALTAGEGMSGTIFMEAGVDDKDYKSEARHVAKLVGSQNVLGQIASCRPEEDAGFDAWLEECSELGVVGFRRILHVMPDELSQSVPFRRNLRKIGKAGLPFDICVLARQLPLARELVRDCDDQMFILNHCGVPDIAGGAFDSWSVELAEIAALSNVCVKLSGISAYCSVGTANIDTLKPWVERVFDCFEPGRIVWGSDWPVVNLGSGLPDWLGMTRALISHLSPAEQAQITHLNAQKIYGV